jgi:hypothetical protein
VVQSQPRQIVPKAFSQKHLHKNRTGGVAQGEGSQFKPQYLKRKALFTDENRSNLIKQELLIVCKQVLHFIRK